MKFTKCVLHGSLILALGYGLISSARATSLRPLTVEDCVKVRTLADDTVKDSTDSFTVSPDGKYLAYIVRVPDVSANVNERVVYIKSSGDASRSLGQKVATGANISTLHWSRDNRHLWFLNRGNGNTALYSVDRITAKQTRLFAAKRDILEYTVDRAEDMMIFAIPSLDTFDHSEIIPPKKLTPEEVARGYRVPFQAGPNAPSGTWAWHKAIYVTRRMADGQWSIRSRLTVADPVTGKPLSDFPTMGYDYPMNLALSPDGKNLLFTYSSLQVLPPQWETLPMIQLMRKGGAPPFITVLCDLRGKMLRPVLKMASTMGKPTWAPDSSSFVLAGPAPANVTGSPTNLNQTFWFDAHSNAVELVSPNTYGIVGMGIGSPPPAYWYADGDLLIQQTANVLERFHHARGWQPIESIHIPFPSPNVFLPIPMVASPTAVFGAYETVMTPVQIFQYHFGDNHIHVFSDLNPQLRDLTFGQVEYFHWKTSFGIQEIGLLVKPIGYVPGRRYPIVIQVKQSFGNWFLCDGGAYHMPAACPQPLANAGIMYLVGSVRGHGSAERAYYAEHFPGGIGEVARETDMWESAIRTLDQRGMIDVHKIGLIGFSRGGWYAQFMLTQSKIQFAAASLIDNIMYSVGSYWLLHDPSTISGYDNLYGGPPYGATLANWMKYSITFRLDKIHTPILMEEINKGVYDDVPGEIPTSLAIAYELFAGLNALQKPVEMYDYPNDIHQMDTPQGRLASLQRNFDWYRFWLQGYERPNPSDPQQYVRWRHLRELQESSQPNHLASSP